MPTIRALPQFSAWLEGLKDARERGAIVARITRLQLGNAGDAASVGAARRWLQEHARGRHPACEATRRPAGLKGHRMTKRIKADTLPEFDAAQYLDSDETVAAYLTDTLADNDPALLAAALGNIARARGMSEIAASSGLAREALYKALRPGSNPRFDTIMRVCAALGVRLVVEPRPAA